LLLPIKPDMMKKISWFEITLILVILISHTYAALSPEKSLMNWFKVDDAFYYFNTARNISNGLGVTFDGINSTNGFHPLWMLVCIPIFFFARYNLFLPFRILVILLGLLNAASAILLYRWISKELSKNAGILAAVIWAFTPLIHSETSLSGLETGLSIFFFILLSKLISESMSYTKRIPIGRLILTGSIAALAFLSRLDNIFIILMVGIWFIFANSSIRLYLVLDTIFIMLAAYASLLFRLGNFIDIYKFSSGLFLFIGLGLIIKIPILFFLSLYQPNSFSSLGKLLRNLLIALIGGEIVSSILVFLLSFTRQGFSFPKSLPLYDLAALFILIGGSRIILFFFSKEQSEPFQSPIQILKENWNSWLRNFAYYFGILAFVMFAYLVLNQLFFQTPLPISSQIKQWWGTMQTVYGIPARTITESLGIGIPQWSLLSNIFNSPGKLILSKFMFLIYIVEFFIIAYLIIKNSHIAKQSFDRLLLLPILGGCFWQIWTYNIRSYVGFRDWYWMNELFFTVLFFVVLYYFLENTIRLFDQKRIIDTTFLVAISTVILIGYTSSTSNFIKFNNSSSQEGEYLFGVSFLEKNTEPGAIVGFTGGGTIGYFIHDRSIINLDGLINSSAYFKSLTNYQAAEFLDKMGLDYIFARPFIVLESEPYKDEFSNRLELISYYESYALYRYLPSP
jgi:hypothetical protein